MAGNHPIISIVVPAYNEQENVRPLVERVRQVLEPITPQYEIIFVSDGSTDDTAGRVAGVRNEDPRVKLIELSRNFGHQLAIMAGLDVASGDAVITMDADLQHPPEMIPMLLARWQAGDDVVHAVRQTSGGSWFQRVTSRMTYRLLRRLCDVDILPNAADFRLLDRRVVEVMRQLRERFRFDRGLVRWLGFRHGQVPYHEATRHAGRPAYRLSHRVRLLTNAVFSLSSKPLAVVGVVGLFISLGTLIYLAAVVAARLIAPTRFGVQAGWASTMAVILLVGGFQLVAVWLLGQYVGRTYEETKHRPPYVVARGLGFDDPALCRTDRPALNLTDTNEPHTK
jgi:glycosyltransferase involved in cell wall biosynthesis